MVSIHVNLIYIVLLPVCCAARATCYTNKCSIHHHITWKAIKAMNRFKSISCGSLRMRPGYRPKSRVTAMLLYSQQTTFILFGLVVWWRFLRAVLLATSFLDGSVLILKTQEKEQGLYSSETHFVCMRYCARHACRAKSYLVKFKSEDPWYIVVRSWKWLTVDWPTANMWEI